MSRICHKSDLAPPGESRGGGWRGGARMPGLLSGAEAGRRSSSFTLIELLVVVTIIAILASLLLPALGRARIQGRSVICLVNLNQYGLGVAQYLNDFNDQLPPAWNWYPTSDTPYGLYPSYVPTWLGGVQWDKHYTTGCPNEDGYCAGQLQPGTSWPDYYVRAYHNNSGMLWYVMHPDDPERNTVEYRSLQSQKMTRIPAPSVAVVVFELWSPYSWFIWSTSSLVPVMNCLPGSGRGMLYGDFHVGREVIEFKDGTVMNNRLKKVQ